MHRVLEMEPGALANLQRGMDAKAVANIRPGCAPQPAGTAKMRQG